MKYHKKAIRFCEEKIFKENGARERLQMIVRNRIESADSDNVSLTKVMEKFGEDYGGEKPEEAIGVLEVLFESLGSEPTTMFLRRSKNLSSDWKKTNRTKLFDIAFNIMMKTATGKKNEDLLKHLNTYMELITNHSKAEKLYNQIDPEGGWYCDSVDAIVNTLTSSYKNALIRMILGFGGGLIHFLPEEAIGCLEALYEALCAKWDWIEGHKLNVDENNNTFSIDALFSLAFYALHEEAQDCPFAYQDILISLETYYPEN